jgi:uncharacterized protein (DUF169 family)
MTDTSYATLSAALQNALSLSTPAIAITFAHEAPDGVPDFPGEPPEAAEDGRTGKVSAGCVFWGKAAQGTFTTRPEDHGNCNVGSYTHGLKTMDEAAQGSDVAALLESGWVTAEDVPRFPMSPRNFPSLHMAHWPRRTRYRT